MAQRARKIKTGISHEQMKLLRYAISSLGLKEHYYDILEAQGGVSSSTELTQAKFKKVLEYLKRQGFEKVEISRVKAPGPYERYLETWKQQAGYRPGMATPEQLAMIDTLWDRLEKTFWNKDGKGNRDAALRGFLQRQCGVSYLMFLKFRREKGDRHSGAFEFIESLKKIGARKKY